MNFVRAAHSGDVKALERMATRSVGGITSLPADTNILTQKIAKSRDDFTRPGNGRRSYLFALDDGGEMVGCSGLTSQTGPEDGLDFFTLAPSGGRFTHFDVGPAELKTLFVDQDHREGGFGRLISLARHLFIALEPNRFAAQVIARLRGYIDDDGHSPFWDEVGRPTYQCDFLEADALRARNADYVRPLGYPDLSDKAQAVVGKTHPNTVAALKLLEDEGFTPTDWIDPFDGGPVYGAARDTLRIVREAKRTVVEKIAPITDARDQIIANTDTTDFRALFGTVEGSGTISQEVAAILDVKVGDEIIYVSTRGGS